MVGSSAKNAVPYKQYIGATAYTLSTLVEIYKGDQGLYKIDIEDGKHVIDNVWTQYMQIYNGKFGGGRIMLNPLGIINDGLMELTFMRGIQTFATGLTLFNGAKSGGLQFYDSMFQCYRCKKVKLSNLKVDKNG